MSETPTTRSGSEKPAAQVRYVRIDAGQEGQRLDNFLRNELKGAPKSLIYRIIRKGEVRVNKKRAKPLQKLCIGDDVRVPPVRLQQSDVPPPPSEQLSQTLRDRILWDDDAFMVVDKPSGLAVHGGSGITLGLIESLRQIFPEYRHLELVHRLDRETSGCVMIAKKRSALRSLHAMLREHHIDKQYHCIVHGRWPEHQTRINVPLRKQVLQSGERMVKPQADAGEGAKRSDTRFAVVQWLPGADLTLVLASPRTGRTHQIRVHAQVAGHPIVGDDKYATSEQLTAAKSLKVKRLLLHASALNFRHPLTDEPVSVGAPLPEAFTRLLEPETPNTP
ncbi:MAG: RluA family pseudouridine synthase [Natronospirillum sp.]|uniref:RluA family pseudouridine synthase n=1 Tax=Natronospirillum sp. TaxID=2812955 RepID=UPI0025FBB558|nr:RluA family pseudouridine synthase [Natronospirillum sp.]MCH8550997.1 RluA family pseudouridine synthase [Natronospirillum sp.]